MTHLKVEQNGIGVGVLPNQTVSKLYQIAQSGELDATSNLKGGIYVTNCKESQKQYLENLYPDFSIMCTGEYYIDFADPVMEQICATTWGDGVGLTRAQAASVTQFGNAFKGNTNITSFDEMQYFTGLGQFNWTYSDNVFTGCTSLTSVDFRAIDYVCTTVGQTEISRYYMSLFKNCSSLTTVKNYNVNWISSYMFDGCSSLQTINLSNVKYIQICGLKGCTKLNVTENGLDFTKIIELGDSCLSGCLGVGDVELPLCTGFGRAFTGCNSVTSVSNCPNITKMPSQGSQWYSEYGGYESTFMSSSIETIDLSLSRFSTMPQSVVGCSNLRIVKLPSTLTQVDALFITRCASLQALVMLATTPPTVNYRGENDTFLGGTTTNQNLKIYVPDESVSLYKTEKGWRDRASNIFPMSQFATDFPND